MRKHDNTTEYIIAAVIIVILLLMPAVYPSAEGGLAHFDVSVLYVPETNVFLYSKNSEAKMPMASTTKIMTALVALEECEMSEVVPIDSTAVGTEGSSAYLVAGELLTMEELIYALLLQSANDAAVAIACHIDGSVEAFADRMNDRAARLGLECTHFEKPHGLDSSEHYTTARDLAKIAAAALENEKLKEIVSTSKKSFVTEERSRTYVNHNKLLRMYDGCIGVKTGYTKKSGRCLVGAAERDGLTFVSVTLDAPSDWQDHKRMLDFGYERLEKLSFAEACEYEYTLPVIDGCEAEVRVCNLEAASLIRDCGGPDFESHVRLARFAVAPVQKGDILGEVIFTIDGKAVARVDLVASETIEKKENRFFGRLASLFR